MSPKTGLSYFVPALDNLPLVFPTCDVLTSLDLVTDCQKIRGFTFHVFQGNQMLSELFGGPFDGVLLDVPEATEVICLPAIPSPVPYLEQRAWYVSNAAEILLKPKRFSFKAISPDFDDSWME